MFLFGVFVPLQVEMRLRAEMCEFGYENSAFRTPNLDDAITMMTREVATDNFDQQQLALEQAIMDHGKGGIYFSMDC